MKTIQEMIDVMQAYQEGKQIQIYDKMHKQWIDHEDKPNWNWGLYDYRVKPKTKYVPFETAEEFLEAQNEHGQVIIQYLNKENTVFKQFYAYVNNLGKIILYGGGDTVVLLTLEQLFNDYYYFDDDLTPCGKKILE